MTKIGKQICLDNMECDCGRDYPLQPKYFIRVAPKNSQASPFRRKKAKPATPRRLSQVMMRRCLRGGVAGRGEGSIRSGSLVLILKTKIRARFL